MLWLIIMAVEYQMNQVAINCFVANISIFRAIFGFTFYPVLPRFYQITQGKTG